MRIDNRILIVAAMPFGLLFLIRAFWLVAGVPWNIHSEGLSVIFGTGIIAGIGIAGFPFLKFGHTQIRFPWSKHPEDRPHD